MKPPQLSILLEQAIQGKPLSNEDILQLLSLKDHESILQVMAAARKVREYYFENRIFLYGFIYFSTYCRNHCTFCFYRKGNQASPRYRKNPEEVLEIACRLVESGVHLVDLTLGEDPLIHNAEDYHTLIRMVAQIKAKTGVAVMISPGVVPDETLKGLAAVQTDWYALYQETHNPLLFKGLRVGQSFEERMAQKTAAHQAGLLVEDGILIGVGETADDRADSIVCMRQSPIDQARVMSFVPQAQTPLAGLTTPPRMFEYLCIAVMRLSMPERLIPASLDVDGIKGLRLEAGANVVTSIIPPHSHLAGVSQSTLDIEQGLRSVPEVKNILGDLGLTAASAEAYSSWLSRRKQKREPSSQPIDSTSPEHVLLQQFPTKAAERGFHHSTAY
jgi:methylornithine synthase